MSDDAKHTELLKNKSEIDLLPKSDSEKKSSSIINQLKDLGGDIDEILNVKTEFPMSITKHYMKQIKEKGDPLWNQSVPNIEEIYDITSFPDPLEEEEHMEVPHVVHKYPDRALLLVTNKCALYCRFCTRKRFVGYEGEIPMEEIFTAIDYIARTPAIRDVIISGGDPLVLPDYKLEQILTRLRAIDHLEMIRIGTRVPCVSPSRINEKLVEMLKKFHPLYMNIHFNHPDEITPEVAQACSLLANAGIPLGSQTVLLKGVNDNPETMLKLMRKLLSIRVRPYYIFQCDFVKGTEHFRTPISVGLNIMKHIQGYTSGLGVPKFVIDGPGGKIPINPDYVKKQSKDYLIVQNYKDEEYIYPINNTGSRWIKIEDQINKAGSDNTIKTIGLTCNIKPSGVDASSDALAEFDEEDTVQELKGALESFGFETIMIQADKYLYDNLTTFKPNFVFNIAEGMQGESRESQVPAMLEMLGIPYSGSGILANAISLNKAKTKDVLKINGINTPNYQLFKSKKEILRNDINFPVILKPNGEGSSIGITNKSVLFDESSFYENLHDLMDKYNQPILVEEYIKGREFTIAVMGNEEPETLPIVEITFNHLPSEFLPIDSYESKWYYDVPGHDPIVCPANVTSEQEEKLKEIAKSVFKAIDVKDFCRIDMRVDDSFNIYVLEINTLPGISSQRDHNSRFTRAAYAKGLTYRELIKTLLQTAFSRYGINQTLN